MGIMARSTALALAALLLVVLSSLCISENGPANETDEGNGGNGDGEGEDGDRPVYYYFYTDVCPACEIMRETLEDPSVERALEANFTVRKVNAAENRQLATKYYISGVPTNVFTFPDGQEMGRLPGAVGPEDFLKVLDQVLEFYANYTTPQQ
jgi:thioredoxin-related protein